MAINTPKQTSHLKREILVRLIKSFLSDNFEENTRLIPYDMRPKGHEVPYRCCIYKNVQFCVTEQLQDSGIQLKKLMTANFFQLWLKKP